MDTVKSLAKQFGFCPEDKADLAKNIAVKLVNLGLGILFVVLRNKMKASGKKGLKYLFTFLAFSCFVGVITSSATGMNPAHFDADAADEDDFVDIDDADETGEAA